MSHEEAIDKLTIILADDDKWTGYTKDGKEAYQQALKMGIEALQEKEIEIHRLNEKVNYLQANIDQMTNSW